MKWILVASLSLIAACSSNPPSGDDEVTLDAGPGDDAGSPDASLEPPAQFMSATIDGVPRTTDSAVLYHGGSFPLAILGTFAPGDVVSIHLDGGEGTVECAYTYTMMMYRPAGATTSFEADGDVGSQCTVTLTDVEPTTDGWVVGTFAGTLLRGAETVTIEDGSFAAYWP